MALPALAEQPGRVLSRLTAQGVRFSSGWMYLIPRIAGVAATLQQQWEAAETLFQTAIAVAVGSGARPELARTYMDYARMLGARGAPDDRQRIRMLLTQVAPLVNELGLWSHPRYKILDTDAPGL